MRYMLTIYMDERSWYDQSESELASMHAQYNEFSEAAAAAGVLAGGAGLQPTSTATTVRVRDGERILTDGPFAETKEQLGGFYLLECEDLDEALGWAARIPGARTGSVEVRPALVTADVPATSS